MSDMVGSIISDKGFVSTSATGNQFGGLQMEITVPVGKGRGAFIAFDSPHTSEGEFLIKRNSRFLVTGYGQSQNGDPVLRMQMLD